METGGSLLHTTVSHIFLSQVNPVHAITSRFFKVHFIIITVDSSFPDFVFYTLEKLYSVCNRILLEKLIVAHLINKFPAFYASRRFIITNSTACYWAVSLARSMHFPYWSLNYLRSALILSSKLRLGDPDGPVILNFPATVFCLFFHVSWRLTSSGVKAGNLWTPSSFDVRVVKQTSLCLVMRSAVTVIASDFPPVCSFIALSCKHAGISVIFRQHYKSTQIPNCGYAIESCAISDSRSTL